MRSLLIGAALLFSAAAAAQDGEWVVPKTMDGVPDLQGTWTNATITSLERVPQFDELVITEEQAAEWEGNMDEMMKSIDDVPEDGLKAGENVGGYNSFWMDPGTRALRVNGEARSSIIVEPANGKMPMKVGARMKLGAFLMRVQGGFDGPEQRPLGERCVVGFGSTGGPPMLPVLYNNNYQIVQSPGYVMILVEMNHNARMIRIDGEPLPEQVTPWMGDSIGTWEGDTLVVVTRNFHPGQSFRAAIKHQFYLTEDAVVTERFTRVSDSEIFYRFEVDDPGAYDQVWAGEQTLRASQETIYEYACHEGNYALTNILNGARLAEREAAAGSGE